MTQLKPANLAVSSVPYHPPLILDGEEISFSHLEPIQLACLIKTLGRELRIEVKFSNHCFSDHLDPDRDNPSWKVMEGIRERVFCRERYGLSFLLPDMVRSLKSAAVRQTRWERNFVYFTKLKDKAGFEYAMFFNLKKAKGSGCQLALYVESAYPIQDATALVRRSSKVMVPVLCGKVFKGEALRFRVRR